MRTKLRKLLLILLLTGLACVPQNSNYASSQAVSTSEKRDSVSFFDGRRWNQMDAHDKPVWLIGYKEGLLFCQLYDGRTGNALLEEMQTLFPDAQGWDAIAIFLDRFYQTPENQPIFVGEAIQVLAHEGCRSRRV